MKGESTVEVEERNLRRWIRKNSADRSVFISRNALASGSGDKNRSTGASAQRLMNIPGEGKFLRRSILNDRKNKEQPLITQLYELSILAQQTYSSAYRAGQIFGYIFLIVLAIAVLKKIFS